MSIETIQADFRRKVGETVRLAEEGIGRYRVFTPFMFEDGDHLVGFGVLEVRFHELVPPALVIVAIGRFKNRSTPFLGSILQPVLKLVGDFRQSPLGHPFPFPIGIEKSEHALGLLERLDQSVALNLTGSGFTVRAGDGDGNLASDGATYSPGYVQQQTLPTGDPVLADSFFDIFFEVDFDIYHLHPGLCAGTEARMR